jgi:hypothetical protein
LTIQVNFTKPLIISIGDAYDQLLVQVIDKTYFVSAETGEMVDPDAAFEGFNRTSIPPQLPEGVSEEDLKSTA